MFLKKLFLALFTAGLLLLLLYTGTACIATFLKVGNQPYLLAGEVRYDFLGYSMMAIANGALFLLILLILLFLIRKPKKML